MRGITKHDIPAFQSLLQRDRIKLLLDKAFQNALVTVVAPTGYGKTHEIANYLKDADVRLAWMRLTELDNLPEHFWSHYIASLTFEFPGITDPLKGLGFPNTLAKMSAWMRIVANEIYKDPTPAVLVIDEFDEISNEEVLMTIEYCLKAGMEASSIVLISRRNTHYDLKALQSGGGIFRVTSKQLTFTVEDTENFFIHSGIHLPRDEIIQIHKQTDGWPLLTYLLSLQLQNDPGSYEDSMGESLDVVYAMFESEFFSNYDDDIKVTLIRLSTLPSFSTDVIMKVGAANPATLTEVLRKNNFVTYSANSGEYIFQNSYRDFLKKKQGETDIAEIFSIAGDSALAKGQQLNAIEYYSKCGRYDDMLDVVVDFIAARMGLNKTHIEFFFEKLHALPAEVGKRNYLVRYIEVCLNIQLLQAEKAKLLLRDMEQELLPQTGEREQAMLGEVYERMAGVHMLQAKECFAEYYKKAYAYIPNGSVYKKKSMLRYKNYSIVTLQDYQPGALQRMEDAVYSCYQYMNAVENGASAGFQYLFSAEAAFYRYELDHALNMAHKALYEAETGEAHDLACDAMLILARVSLMRGKYADVLAYIRRVGEYISEIKVSGLNDVTEYANTWLDLSLGSTVASTTWIRSVDASITINAPLAVGRDEYMYAIYLMHQRRYGEMTAYLEQVRPWYITKGWGDSLVINIMLALGYLKLGDEERAIDTLKETYDQTYANGIITPYIEFGSMMRALIDRVRKSGRTDFDPAWLDNISSKSTTFAKRLSYMIKEHAKQTDSAAAPIGEKLTSRELDVLQSLTQGLTREEIAEEKNIKGNTVKSIIRSIYNKLGAMNRADAVRIAMESDILV